MVKAIEITSLFVPAVCVLAAGCTQVDKGFSAVQETVGETYNAAEKKITDALSDRGNRYCLQAGGLSALAGGAAGAGAGYLLSHDTKGALIGAAIGSIGSAIAGCRYGVWVGDRRESYDTESEWLDAELGNAVATNESLVQLNQQFRTGLEERKQQLAQLKTMQGGDQKRLEKEQLAKELGTNRKGIGDQLVQATKELSIHRSTLADLQKSSSASAVGKEGAKKSEKALADVASADASADQRAKIAEYKKNIAEMGKAIAEMRSLNEQYAKTDSRVAAI